MRFVVWRSTEVDTDKPEFLMWCFGWTPLLAFRLQEEREEPSGL